MRKQKAVSCIQETAKYLAENRLLHREIDRVDQHTIEKDFHLIGADGPLSIDRGREEEVNGAAERIFFH